MVDRSVIGQLDLFPVADFQTSNAASNFSSGISQISTRTKAFISPHKPISKETIARVSAKLISLPNLKTAQTIT